ncbi:uncharacterized protein LOC143646475 isoform X2 [Tamandua tetradactyla]|uniref:uncharacterized protein LOC143646475 isoform X2 n=1 Tax=Tamandua tetradactyla TaxID=48850 RepID=UPI0040549C5A
MHRHFLGFCVCGLVSPSVHSALLQGPGHQAGGRAVWLSSWSSPGAARPRSRHLQNIFWSSLRDLSHFVLFCCLYYEADDSQKDEVGAPS